MRPKSSRVETGGLCRGDNRLANCLPEEEATTDRREDEIDGAALLGDLLPARAGAQTLLALLPAPTAQ